MLFLHKFKIDTSGFTTTSFGEWSVGSRIFGEGALFEIRSIDHNNNTANIASVMAYDNKVVSFEKLNQSYVSM